MKIDVFEEDRLVIKPHYLYNLLGFFCYGLSIVIVFILLNQMEEEDFEETFFLLSAVSAIFSFIEFYFLREYKFHRVYLKGTQLEVVD